MAKTVTPLVRCVPCWPDSEILVPFQRFGDHGRRSRRPKVQSPHATVRSSRKTPYKRSGRPPAGKKREMRYVGRGSISYFVATRRGLGIGFDVGSTIELFSSVNYKFVFRENRASVSHGQLSHQRALILSNRPCLPLLRFPSLGNEIKGTHVVSPGTSGTHKFIVFLGSRRVRSSKIVRVSTRPSHGGSISPVDKDFA